MSVVFALLLIWSLVRLWNRSRRAEVANTKPDRPARSADRPVVDFTTLESDQNLRWFGVEK